MGAGPLPGELPTCVCRSNDGEPVLQLLMIGAGDGTKNMRIIRRGVLGRPPKVVAVEAPSVRGSYDQTSELTGRCDRCSVGGLVA